MAGPLARSYGAATMVGADERNGRINPALETDDDLPVSEAQRLKQPPLKTFQGGGGQGIAVPTADHDNTAF